MQHFPVFLNVAGRRVAVSGAGETALAKLRLLIKTEARISVFGDDPVECVETLAAQGRIVLHRRPIREGDTLCVAMLYCANDDDAEDARAATIGRAGFALVNIVDNLRDSAFITPAIVDRDPVTIAIGTEGAAPVLARRIKADLEERLPQSLGVLARIGQAFRGKAARIPQGRKRRAFWSRYYDGAGAQALEQGGPDAVKAVLDGLLGDALASRPAPGRVSFVGAGPGDPDLLTMKVRRMLHEADVVLHDRLVPAPILELARREATIIETGKSGFGPSMAQDDINAAMIEHAGTGAHVVRLKSGDPGIFGRLDEETDALIKAGIAFDIVPGITAASAAAANIGASLTRRGRNGALTVLTAHDMNGFAEHDWRALANGRQAAAIYMGVKAATFIEGRLLMHGADAAMPVTIVENASRPDQRVIEARLGGLAKRMREEGVAGPAVLLYGIAPRDAASLASADLARPVSRPALQAEAM